MHSESQIPIEPILNRERHTSYQRYENTNEMLNRYEKKHKIQPHRNTLKETEKENHERQRRNSENMAPNKSPYLEMPSVIALSPGKEKVKNKDLGSVIESLNNKLNNYIEFNKLEDTYRRFKLDFVQLKKNMG